MNDEKEPDPAQGEKPEEFEEGLRPQPWIDLRNPYEAEAWIDLQNRELQELMKAKNAGAYAKAYGICITLAAGGDIYLHTTPDGDILLDVTSEAEWVAPLIAAATRVAAPTSSLWVLPADTLAQLILGLNSLIASTRMVTDHAFRMRKSW